MPTPQAFTTTVIKPVLLKLGLHSPAAEQLLLATAIQESHLKYRKQIGGPALSYFQIEPNTHDDIWNNFLKYRPQLSNKVIGLMSSPVANKIKELENNDKYAAAIARIHYLRVPAPIPQYNKFINNWKKYGSVVKP